MENSRMRKTLLPEEDVMLSFPAARVERGNILSLRTLLVSTLLGRWA